MRVAMCVLLAACSARPARDGARVTVGRRWIGPRAEVLELELDHVAHPAIGAAVIEASGAVRVYLDEPTLHGELRGPPPTTLDTTIAIARDTPVERANLATTDRIWSRLDAHDPDGVMAFSAPGYLYDDLSGPAPLDTQGTHDLLVRFLAVVPDFVIAEKPVYFAAGDDVITESVEHMTFGGRAITLRALDVKHFVDGKVAREWQYANGAEAAAAFSAPSASATPSPPAR